MSIRQTTLPNGLRVITEHRAHVETVAVGVWVNAGSRGENVKLNGITHFLEHMVFKGTDKRNARQIATEIETVGGHLNAYTTRDYTTFYARVLKGDVPLAIDLLADILLNSKFEDKEIVREQEVVIQEIGQAFDTPDDIIFDHLQEISFKDQALGRPILGSTNNVNSFNRDMLQEYISTQYKAGSMVVAAAGNLDHDVIVAEVERGFGGVQSGTAPLVDAAEFIGGTIREHRDLEQVHVTLGLPGCSYYTDDYYAMQVYSMLLGGGMSSRLFQEVRENRGLAYSVYSFANSHVDTGLFGIYAGTAPEMVNEMLDVISGEMKSLTSTITMDELQIAKAQLKAGLLMGLEATSSRIEQMGRQLLVFDRTIPAEEMVANIESVNLDDVHAMASNMYGSKLKSSVFVGDLQKLQP